MKQLVFIIALFLITGKAISENPFVISGKVTDENGTPLTGVLIIDHYSSVSVRTDINGTYTINTEKPNTILIFTYPGKETLRIETAGRQKISVTMHSVTVLNMDDDEYLFESRPSKVYSGIKYSRTANIAIVSPAICPPANFNTEGYSTIHENGFKSPLNDPLSTFSADVDRASYSNIRRFLNNGSLPPKDAVRVEEMINYFKYSYEEPAGNEPFAVSTELAVCPWNKEHLLLKTSIKSKEIEKDDLPPSNLVFLIDVSGSMYAPNKLPLLKSSFMLLVDQLRPEDHVSIVVYAGAAGLVLEPTSGNEKEKILRAVEKLQAGGSTAGGEGLRLAYKTAEKNFIKNGNNRIILATDGDFNIGESSNAAMERLIESERDKGIFISVLGFGTGNYKDDKMEIIADKGNGNYAYIDNLQEARKTLVSEFGGTLFTIAKDVKFQIEFNPGKVAGYRLIGYENRLLNKEDFNDDTKDAGDIGAGHTVTALYEIIPKGASDEKKWIKPVDELKYTTEAATQNKKLSNEWLTLKMRYKEPENEKSKLIVKTIKGKPEKLNETTNDFRFAAAVASFGMLLRNSEYINTFTFKDAEDLAKSSLKNDDEGFRAEMVRLMHTAETLQQWTAKK